MTTIQSGNLKCMTCGAVHLIDHPIATHRLSQLHEAFKVLHEDCREVAISRERTLAEFAANR